MRHLGATGIHHVLDALAYLERFRLGYSFMNSGLYPTLRRHVARLLPMAGPTLDVEQFEANLGPMGFHDHRYWHCCYHGEKKKGNTESLGDAAAVSSRLTCLKQGGCQTTYACPSRRQINPRNLQKLVF